MLPHVAKDVDRLMATIPALDPALEAFTKALGQPGSAFYAQALLRIAFTRYLKRDFTGAVASFVADLQARYGGGPASEALVLGGLADFLLRHFARASGVERWAAALHAAAAADGASLVVVGGGGAAASAAAAATKKGAKATSSSSSSASAA